MKSYPIIFRQKNGNRALQLVSCFYSATLPSFLLVFLSFASYAHTQTEQQLEKTSVSQQEESSTSSPAPVKASPPDPFEDEPAGKEDSSFTMQLLNMFVTLGMLLAVVLLATWALKRMMRTRMQQVNLNSSIKIIEQRALTNRTIISLIEIRGKEIAIAESSNGVTLLYPFPTPTTKEIL